jgi:hypothetical protein
MPSGITITHRYPLMAATAEHAMPALPVEHSMIVMPGRRCGDPAVKEGMDYLMKNLPDINRRDIYYWYYATQVMHNLPGPEWDTWNRQMRRILIDTQVKEGCAAGSWDPAQPTADKHREQGGRVMVTSLSALTLEVYYRYLPLYKLDKEDDMADEANETVQAAK